MKSIPLSLLVCALFFVGCSQRSDIADSTNTAPGSENQKIVLMVYANEGMYSNYQNVTDRFNSIDKEVQVEIRNIYGEDWSDFDRVFKSYVYSGLSPDIVDVSVVYRDSLIRQGMLKDIMPFAQEKGIDFDLYFENQFDGLLFDDALYGIPSGAMLMAVYVNKELFRKAGIELPPLDWNDTWSWSEYADSARQIRGLSTPENPIYGVTQSYSIGWIIPFFLSNGSPFLTEQGAECNGEDSAVSDTLEFLNNLMFIEENSPSLMDLVNLQPYQYFMNGSLGIFVDGNWWMEGFRDAAEFDWGVVPMPKSKNTATGMYVDSWSIPEASSNGKNAYEVLDFFLAEEQQRSGIMKGIPLLKSVAHEIYSERFPTLSESEINVWFQGIEYGKVPTYFSGWSQFQDDSTEILHKYGFGELTTEEATRLICDSYQANNSGEFH